MTAAPASADPMLMRLTGRPLLAPPQSDPGAALVLAVRRALDATGRKRVLLSGSVDPGLAAAVATAIGAGDAILESLAPDPLGFEDLAGRIGGDLAALVIQSPDPFGGDRPLGLAAALCREEGVIPIAVIADPAILAVSGPPEADLVVLDGGSPLLGLNAPLGFLVGRADLAGREAPPPTAAAIAAAEVFLAEIERQDVDGLKRRVAAAAAGAGRLRSRLNRIGGIRVVSPRPGLAVMTHLGDGIDAEEVARRLTGMRAVLVRAAGPLYPAWPELWPVLMISATEMVGDDDLDALVAALTAVR